MKRILALAVIAAALVAGCGGGGGSNGVVPGPNPGGGKDRVIISWSGPGHSLKPLSRARHQTTTNIEPIEIGAADNYPNSVSLDYVSGQETAAITVTVVDAQGSPVPEPTPTIAVADPSIATEDAQYQTVSSTLTPGTTTLTASFPDGNSGSIAILSYAPLGTACYGTGWHDAAEGWSFASGQPVAVTDPSQADISVQGDSRCTPPFQGPGYTLSFQYGYEMLPLGTPMGQILSASGFVSAGTTLDVPTYEGLGAPPLIFKTSTGQYVKLRCSVFEGAEAIGAISMLSDSSGNFAY